MRECPCGECKKQGCGKERCSAYRLWRTIKDGMDKHRREKSAAWNGVTEYNQERYIKHQKRNGWR